MTNIGSPWKEGRRLGTLEERDRTQRYLKLVKEEYWKGGDIKACQLVDEILEGLYLPFGKGCE